VKRHDQSAQRFAPVFFAACFQLWWLALVLRHATEATIIGLAGAALCADRAIQDPGSQSDGV